MVPIPGLRSHVVLRPARACLAALLLAAVASASTLDGEAADFVGGDDGDALAARRQEEPALYSASAPRAPDVCGTHRRAPLVAAVDSPHPSRNAFALRVRVSNPTDLDGIVASPPLPSRAPPAA